MKTEVETGLVKMGDKKLGSHLLDLAVEKNREKFQDRVVETIRQNLEEIEQQKEVMEDCSKMISFLERRIEALREGKFRVERSGAIKFEDKELHETNVSLHQNCSQCGYVRSIKPNWK